MCPSDWLKGGDRLIGLTADGAQLALSFFRRGVLPGRSLDQYLGYVARLHDEFVHIRRFFNDEYDPWSTVDKRLLIYPTHQGEPNLLLIHEFEGFIAGQNRLTAREWLDQAILMLGLISAQDRGWLYDSEKRFFERDLRPFLIQLGEAALTAQDRSFWGHRYALAAS